ncbi:MAG: hypothetical protein R8J41_11085 [Alphaproteobacteria bacterium]|nr:hypothetical protein [Alphaproteobacteria bacterium]
MSTENGKWPFPSAANVGQEFASSAASNAETEQSEERQTVALTAEAEIDNAVQHQSDLNAHADSWLRERDQIAAAPAYTLEPHGPLDGARSVQEEYAARREIWEQRKDAIDRHHEDEKKAIREAGTSLSTEFTQEARLNEESGRPFDPPSYGSYGPETHTPGGRSR